MHRSLHTASGSHPSHPLGDFLALMTWASVMLMRWCGHIGIDYQTGETGLPCELSLSPSVDLEKKKKTVTFSFLFCVVRLA